jgi:hypothetical protein
MILEIPAAGNSAANSFGIGADFAILETIDAVIPVACGKFPAVAGQGIFSRGAGNFPRQGSDFLRQRRELPFRDRRHEIKPCVARQYPLIASASVHYRDTDIRPSQTRRERADDWQSAVPLMAAAQ